MSDEKKNFGLERVVPVFPLPNVVLFPRVRLPLHIFEPRYRQMVKDAVATHRLIGMALLRGDWQKDYSGNPDIYSTGCLGEIVDVTPFPDGRFNIVLLGLRDYEVKEHILNLTSYRQARVLLGEEPERMEKLSFSSVRGEILDLVRQVIEDKGSPLLDVLRDPSLDQETWLNLCSFLMEVSFLEKQSLLEARSLKDRASYLVQLLQFKVAEKGIPFEAQGDPREKGPPH